MADATRQLFYGMSEPERIIMYLLLIPTLAVFLFGIWQRWKFLKAGKTVQRFDNWSKRLGNVGRYVLGHVRLFKNPAAGISHFFIFWGMILLFIGTVIITLQADFGIETVKGAVYLIYLSLVLDLVGLVAVTGLIYMLVNRLLIRPERLVTAKPDFITSGLLLLIMLQGFLLEGMRIALTHDQWQAWSPVGSVVAILFGGVETGTLLSIYKLVWWFHLLTAFFWIGYLPYSKTVHIITGMLNVYFSDLGPKYQAINLVNFENEDKLGITGTEDFTWKERLDLIACTECGRCQDVCPAYSTNMPISPRRLILNFRDGMEIKDEMVWACTTCRACMEVCPLVIDHVPKVINLRRYLVMEDSEFPELLQEVSRSFDSRSHPYKGVTVTRQEWYEGLEVPTINEAEEVDYLYWVGCTAAFDQRNQKVAREFTKVLLHKGISFAVLGAAEACCGDVARRMGDEYTYEMLARSNIEMLNGLKFKHIVTTCPHCMHVLGNEYRQLGGEYEVLHHTQLLSKLGITADAKNITFHDPCYLGRWNDEYKAPRKILGQVLEMERSRERSFCCGAGGGHAWLEEKHDGPRINQERAKQAINTGAEGVCTACPFCMQMLEDGIKTIGGEDSNFFVKDIAELVAESMNLQKGLNELVRTSKS